MSSIKEGSYLVSSAVVIVSESIISAITIFLPGWMIEFFTQATRTIFSILSFTFFRNAVHDQLISEMSKDKVSANDTIYSRIHHLQKAGSIEEMCMLFGYRLETHLVITRDKYILTLHRLKPGKNQKKANGKLIYLHHGLLMSSEVWCTMADKKMNLPFLLCDLGYDVWLGNNRGNKYSNRSLKYNINDQKFWDFSIDEFCIYDIPDSIDYILNNTDVVKKITYIGFSQGSTQGLAALSTNAKLNKVIDKMIIISPATTPKGLHNALVSSLFRLSPNLIFLLFGRKILLTSATFWQSIIYPPLFIKVIDMSNQFLFNWKSLNIDYKQKFASYYHLYSTTSVKSVCHWFQIIKSKKFQMYNYQFNSIYKLNLQNLEFPTDTNIEVPILLIYGKIDSLVNIDNMKTQLPSRDLKVVGVENHEHLDLLWGDRVDQLVFKNLIRFLEGRDLVDVPGISIETDDDEGYETDNVKTTVDGE